MEKNKLFLFLFAMIPGMSHMYLGMLKKGVFLMSLFLAPIGLIFLTRGGMEIISCVLPVVWCYSFFDTFRYKGYTKEVRYRMDAEFFDSAKAFWQQEAEPMLYRRRKWVGLFCIILAIYTFIYNIIGYFFNWFGGKVFWAFYIILSKVPTLLVVLLLLKLGIDLLKKEDEDFVIYHKQNNMQQKQTVSTKTEQTDTNIQQQEVVNNDKEEVDYVEKNIEEDGKVVEPIFLEKRIEE